MTAKQLRMHGSREGFQGQSHLSHGVLQLSSVPVSFHLFVGLAI